MTFRFEHFARIGALLGVLLCRTSIAAPGDHIVVGNTTIVPGVRVGFEHDTNVYRQENNLIDGTLLHVAPSFDLTTKTLKSVYDAHFRYDYRKYFQRDVWQLDRYQDFELGGGMNVLQDSIVGFRLRNDMNMRTIAAESQLDGRPFETQFTNRFGTGILVRPGAAMRFDVGGLWHFEDYKLSSNGDIGTRGSFNRKNVLGPTWKANWEFFPETSLIIDGSYEWHYWQNNYIDGINASASGDIGEALGLPNSELWRLRAGVRGRITPRFETGLMIGYGEAAYDEETVEGGAEANGQGYSVDLAGIERLLVELQIRYAFSQDDALTVGYNKDFRDVYFTNFAEYHNPYVRLQFRFGPRFGLVTEFQSPFEGYRGEISRRDYFIRPSTTFSVYFQDWMEIYAGAAYELRLSNDPTVQYGGVVARLGTQMRF